MGAPQGKGARATGAILGIKSIWNSTCKREEGQITSSGWPFVSAVLGQMAHLDASITLDSARSYVMQSTFLTQGTLVIIVTVVGASVTVLEDEELREFTSEYYTIRIAPGSAGCECEYSDDPEGRRLVIHTGSLPKDERPPPGSYSIEDAELINENHGEEPLLESTVGRTMELVLEQPEVESTDVLAPTPLRSVPGATRADQLRDARARQEVASGQTKVVVHRLRRKPRMRHPRLLLRSVEATSDSSAPVTHAVQSPPQTSPLTADDISRRDRETGPKAFEGMPVDQLMEEFDMVTAQQAALVAQLRARFSSERSQSVQKDEEILRSEDQLQMRRLRQSLRGKLSLGCEVFGGGKNNHFAGLDEFRQRVEELLEKQEEKLRKLSIEYDEELYPHMLSAIAERSILGDVVKCALARGKAEAVEELHEKKLLTVPAAQVPGYNDNAYEELVAAMETMKLHRQPRALRLARLLSQLGPCANLQFYSFARPRDILNPFALEKEIPLKESLEAHAIRLAKKIGRRARQQSNVCWCSAHPRSDGVPVSVATVSPKDSELLGKLKEAGDAAYQVGRSEQSRCHSI
ncbi:hypothetical protein Tco_0976059 [Tanacetum coccineum]|uniref:Uncharacterized protein n=1 Tax=Tanacetum coccineum TaxID=301880 RepID=A0ABQ5EHA6_9ASTR